MLFSSTIFLFFFLPITLLSYFLVGSKLKNLVLLIFSMIFYAWGGVSYTIIFFISIIFNYFMGLAIAQSVRPKRYLIFGVGVNLLLLIVFKYAGFLVQNLNELFSSFAIPPVKDPHILLPIGISFYTFQSLSYLVDIYRKEVAVQKRFVDLALYISLFPQLIAGPIVRYKDIAFQLQNKAYSLTRFGSGVEQFIIGLSKKVLLANNFGEAADHIFAGNIHDLSSPLAWLGIIAYALQIYFDFSGYSDMAIGLGRMLGFDFLENFNFPYISKSIQEFWRRWHISLSTWFRDYLYIPLGGNRVSKSRVYVNLLIVFTMTGFWHGASWNFLIWGLFHGLFLVIERLGFSKILSKIGAPFSNFYVIVVVLIGWVFFRVESLSEALLYIARLFSFQFQDESTFWSFFDLKFMLVLGIGLISSTAFFPWLARVFAPVMKKYSILDITFRSFYLLLILSMFLLSAFYLVADTYNPFIYYRF